MAIRTQLVPTAAIAALAQDIEWAESRPLQSFADASAVRLTDYVPPHPLYYLSLGQLIDGEGLDRATPIGWRHFSEQDGALWSLFTEDQGAGDFRLAWKSRVQVAETRLSSLQYLGSLSSIREDFEFRAVTIPPLIELGFWLINPSRQISWILPVETCVNGLAVGQVRTEPEIVQLLQNPARQLMAFTPEIRR